MSHSASPYQIVAATGKKHYHETAPQNIKVCNSSTNMISDAIANIQLSQKEAFVICDYGAADGGTSMSVIREVIGFIKQKFGTTKQIHVIYEELPSNNFNSLFDVITGDMSYLTEYSNVYVTACGTSFDQQCLPTESVHLGISYSAMHWLSHKPCDVSGGIFINGGTDHSPGEMSMFVAQAAKDWETNLLCRASELKPGGSLVLAIPCTDNRGYCQGMRPGVKESMFKVLSTLWKNMMTEGIITKEELIKTTVNFYMRTPEEFEAPFNDADSAVRKAGLKLVEITVKVIECQYLKSWKESGNTADNTTAARAHAKQLVLDIQRWSRSTMLCGLLDSRSDKEKNAIVEEFYKRCESEIAQDPNNYCYDYIHAHIHISKELY